MNKCRKQMAEQFLSQALGIICLLTGEEYTIVKKRPSHSSIHQLSREVPIKCDDVAVYFSMEEWEYIEGHKELYKDVMEESHQALRTMEISELTGHSDENLDTGAQGEIVQNIQPVETRSDVPAGDINADVEDQTDDLSVTCQHEAVEQEMCYSNSEGRMDVTPSDGSSVECEELYACDQVKTEEEEVLINTATVRDHSLTNNVNSLVPEKEKNISTKRISKRRFEELSLSQSTSATDDVQKQLRRQEETAAAKQLLDDVKDKHNSNEAAATNRKMENRMQELGDENERLRQLIVTDLPGVLDTLKTTAAQLIAMKNDGGISSWAGSEPSRLSASGLAEELLSSSCKSSYSRLKQIELHPGTGVYLSVPQWTAAHQCGTASAFVRVVIVGLFDTETLIRSNFKGGASKRPTNGEKRMQLDPVKTSALTAATLEKFPGTSKGVISDAVNRKIAELKYRLLKETSVKTSAG